MKAFSRVFQAVYVGALSVVPHLAPRGDAAAVHFGERAVCGRLHDASQRICGGLRVPTLGADIWIYHRDNLLIISSRTASISPAALCA